jgi:hypothetical protein
MVAAPGRTGNPVTSKKSKSQSRMDRSKTAARQRPASEILASVRKTLIQTECGLNDLGGQDPLRREHGLRDVIVYGRAVTFPLQNLHESDETVDDEGHGDWYRENVKLRMRNNDVAKFFVALRNRLEKEGSLEVAGRPRNEGIYIERLSLQDLRRSAPAGTDNITVDADAIVRFRQADTLVRETAWPGMQAIIGEVLKFEDTPPELAGQTVEQLATAYVDLLRDVVAAAEARFGQQPGC